MGAVYFLPCWYKHYWSNLILIMACHTAKYRFVSADNLAAVWQAWFNNALPEKDLELMMSPDNKMTVSLCITEKGYKMDLSVSLKPEMTTTFEGEFGVEKELSAPFNCKSSTTRVGECGLKEVTKYPDGNIYTSTATFTSHGYSSKICGPNGYVGTAYFELDDPCMTGFYVLESHENGDKMMAEDANLPVSKMVDVLKNLAMRVTENNGYFSMTDYMGNGASKTITFKLGEEFEVDDQTFQMKGTEIVTKNGPGSYSMVYKDSKSGKTSVWDATLTDDLFTFKVTKPLNTTCATFTYRRLADITGTIKLVATSNGEAALREYGMPESMIQSIAAERPYHCVKYTGNGMYCWESGSKTMPIPPVSFKSGEEFSYKMQDIVINEVLCITKDGFVGSSMAAGKKTVINAKVGKNFVVAESMIDGLPHTRSTSIFARL